MATNGTNTHSSTRPYIYNYAKVYNSGNSYVSVDQEAIAQAVANALNKSRQHQRFNQWF